MAMFNSYVCLPEGKFNMGPQTLLCGGGESAPCPVAKYVICPMILWFATVAV